MSDLRHYSNICLEGPRKTSGFCSQNLNIHEDKIYVHMHILYSYIFCKQTVTATHRLLVQWHVMYRHATTYATATFQKIQHN